MPDNVQIGEPGDGGGRLFGLPTPLVLIGGGILGVLFVASVLRKPDTTGTVPISTAVQLGDIQERQMEIMSNLSHGFAGASAERSAYNQNVMQALSASETAVKDQLDALNQSVNGNFAAMTGAQKAYQAELMGKLSTIQGEQKAYYTSLQGDINWQGAYNANLTQGWGILQNAYNVGFANTLAQMQQQSNLNTALIVDKTTALVEKLKQDNTLTGGNWASWYQGWLASFGSTKPGNPYDLNQDNVVDVLDYAIARRVFGG